MIDRLKANETVENSKEEGKRYRIIGGNLKTEVADIMNMETREVTRNVGWSTLSYTGEPVSKEERDEMMPVKSIVIDTDYSQSYAYVCAKCGEELDRVTAHGEKEVYSTIEWGGYDGITEDFDIDSLCNDGYAGTGSYECSHCKYPLLDVDIDVVSSILQHNSGYIDPEPVMKQAKVGDRLLHRDLTKSILLDIMDIGDEAKIVGYKTSRMHHVHNVICEVNGMWLANPPLKSCNDVIAVL